MGEKLTAEEALVLRRPPPGPRPGSNDWPLIQAEYINGVTVGGEIIDGLIRRGLLAPKQTEQITTLPPTENSLSDHDVDLAFQYETTPAGREALSEKGRA